jgi:excisionase family DNA binding protein
MYAMKSRGLSEARESEVVSDADRGPTDYEARIKLDFGAVYTLEEVAEKLGISKRQVQDHVRDRTLVAIDVGRGSARRDLRVLDEDLEGFALRRRVGPVETSAVAAPKPPAKAKVAAAAEPMDYIARRAARIAAREARNG